MMTKLKTNKQILGALAALFTLLTTAAAHAQVTAETIKAENTRWYAIAAAIGLGIAAFGGALGQGRAAAAALDGISRNPGASDKLFTPMILGLALIESLVIYSLLIAFLLYGKI
jgi:F-type H+-transporting ATPase subunit c